MIAAGDLRELVYIQRPSATTDEYGSAMASATWEDVGCFYASIKPLRAKEILRSDTPGNETTYIVKMRYDQRITPECRVKWQPTGTILALSSLIDVDMRHRVMELICTIRRDAAVG